mgnify:CR=1 FL=1
MNDLIKIVNTKISDAEIKTVNARDMKLYELRMLVLGYMQNEDPKKAAEVFEKWIQEVKESGDE